MVMIHKQLLSEYLSKPLREEVVEIDGHQWRLRQMTEDQGTTYELALQDKKGKIDFSKARRLMISLMLIDEEGNRVSENEADIKNLSRAVAAELFSRCQDLNAYGKAEIEDIVKKSEEAES